MPIDVALIRAGHEGGIPEEVQKWQVARFSNHQHHQSSSCVGSTDGSSSSNSREQAIHSTIGMGHQIEGFVANLQKMDIEKRSLLKKQSLMKTRINRLKAALCPRNNQVINDTGTFNMDLNEIQNEIQNLKLLLPRVAKEFDDLDSLLHYNIFCLGNIVDDAEFESLPDLEKLNDIRGVEIQEHCNQSYPDPLFCVGGCETMLVLSRSVATDENFNMTLAREESKSFKEKYILTGPGSEMYTALAMYGKRYFSTCCNALLDDTVKIIHLPQHITLPATVAHGVYGCAGGSRRFQSDCHHPSNQKSCQICNHQEEVRVPSYLALALMNENKIYSEKSLPCTYLIQGSGGSDTISEFAHDMARLEIFSFTVNNLCISRQYQNDMAQMILDFYKTLLCSKTELRSFVSLVTTSNEQPLRVRVLPPSELDMNECRRVVVEGHVPSKKQYVELAYVSNYTDYISRQFKIRCVGGNAQSTDYVHMIKCTLLQETAIRWVAENNLSQVHRNHNNESDCSKPSIVPGIVVPTALTPLFVTKRKSRSENCIVFLPFIREITKGKGGKMRVIPSKYKREEINVGALGQDCNVNGKIGKSEESSQWNATERSMIITTVPNPNDEAICNPYDFLPLFRDQNIDNI
jgi:seryl-tRNA synthetase